MKSYRLIVTSHNSDYSPEQVKWWPDGFAWVSKFHARLFARECLERCIPYGVVEYRLRERVRPERTQALQALGLNPERWHVLSVGLFAPWKDQATVWRAARELPHIQFHCVGNQADNFRVYWKSLMDDKPANVTVWNERSDVDDFYAAMDLLMFTSTKECFPLVVKEALSRQMPVLLRELPVYCDVYDNEPLVTYMREDELADQLRTLLPSMASELLALYTPTEPRALVAQSNDGLKGFVSRVKKKLEALA
jgi:glycosyltransferase involved in cell wall biosynthesis